MDSLSNNSRSESIAIANSPERAAAIGPGAVSLRSIRFSNQRIPGVRRRKPTNRSETGFASDESVLATA